MPIIDYITKIKEKVGEFRVSRDAKKIDADFKRQYRSAWLGDSSGEAEYDDDWISYAPHEREDEENIEGVIKSIQESTREISNRSRYAFDEKETAVRWVQHLSNKARSELKSARSVYEHHGGDLIEGQRQKAEKMCEKAIAYAEMAKGVVDTYDLDDPGFEEHPETLALITGQEGLSQAYRNADNEEEQEQLQQEIEENAVQQLHHTMSQTEEIEETAETFRETVKNQKDNTYEDYRSVLENDPERYAEERRKYGYDDSHDFEKPFRRKAGLPVNGEEEREDYTEKRIRTALGMRIAHGKSREEAVNDVVEHMEDDDTIMQEYNGDTDELRQATEDLVETLPEDIEEGEENRDWETVRQDIEGAPADVEEEQDGAGEEETADTR